MISNYLLYTGKWSIYQRYAIKNIIYLYKTFFF